tara:strand:+ start:1305 stop:1601 length:297 start_codon:yes stop_codon:yes gene_type:complete
MNTVKLGPYNIQVERQLLDDKTYGSYEGFPDSLIIVDARLEGKAMVLTFIHEIIEAIIDMYDIPLGETHVRILELTVGRFVEDNPELVRGWLEVLSGS